MASVSTNGTGGGGVRPPVIAPRCYMPVPSNSNNVANDHIIHHQNGGGMVSYAPGSVFLNCDVKQAPASSAAASVNLFGQYRSHQQFHNGTTGGVIGGAPIAYNARIVGKCSVLNS